MPSIQTWQAACPLLTHHLACKTTAVLSDEHECDLSTKRRAKQVLGGPQGGNVSQLKCRLLSTALIFLKLRWVAVETV